MFRSHPLLTDLYELTMGEVYLREGLNDYAVFEMNIRHKKERNYYVSVGVLELAKEITQLRFSEEDIEYLKSLNRFSEDFLNYLKNFKFRGDIWGIPDGRIFFANEPVVVIKANRIDGQILETLVLNTLAYQINSASKAARVYSVAKGKLLMEFGARRASGIDAAVKASKAAYIAGFDGTSNLLAGKIYGIPVFGTMAHSFVQTFPSEFEAFLTFAKVYPDNAIFLVDTYDTVAGIEVAIEVMKLLMGSLKMVGIRIDSGDIVELSNYAKKRFEEEGLNSVKIVLSGDLDEWKIAEVVREGYADAFGVGTEIVLPSDRPSLGAIYKLVEDKEGFKHKFSKGKVVIGGSKQVYRLYRGDGKIEKDIIAHESVRYDGEPLLVPIVKEGELVLEHDVKEARERFLRDFSTLPDEYKDINITFNPPIEYSQELKIM
jgi:nicotinate phosphoribosyltransferase